jgi:hypothetical protein
MSAEMEDIFFFFIFSARKHYCGGGRIIQQDFALSTGKKINRP